MKRIYTFLLLIGLLFSGCSSSTDDIEVKYTGPWEIVYREVYYGIHNDREEFTKWFNDHLNCFEVAVFENSKEGMYLEAINGDCVMLSDYDEWYSGEIVWVDTIQKATEPEIKEMVSGFESMTIRNSQDRKVDKFAAEYRKLKD